METSLYQITDDVQPSFFGSLSLFLLCAFFLDLSFCSSLPFPPVLDSYQLIVFSEQVFT